MVINYHLVNLLATLYIHLPDGQNYVSMSSQVKYVLALMRKVDINNIDVNVW